MLKLNLTIVYIAWQEIMNVLSIIIRKKKKKKPYNEDSNIHFAKEPATLDVQVRLGSDWTCIAFPFERHRGVFEWSFHSAPPMRWKDYVHYCKAQRFRRMRITT